MRFLGNSETKIDIKGQVFLPAIFRKQIQKFVEECLIMCKDTFQNCLVLYLGRAWNELVSQLRARHNRWDSKHQTIFCQFASDVETIL